MFSDVNHSSDLSGDENRARKGGRSPYKLFCQSNVSQTGRERLGRALPGPATQSVAVARARAPFIPTARQMVKLIALLLAT